MKRLIACVLVIAMALCIVSCMPSPDEGQSAPTSRLVGEWKDGRVNLSVRNDGVIVFDSPLQTLRGTWEDRGTRLYVGWSNGSTWDDVYTMAPDGMSFSFAKWTFTKMD